MAYVKKRPPFPERFWALVDNSGGPGVCWPFTRTKGSVRGYGRISWDGRLWLAHRVSFTLSNGHKPVGLVCHTCDNPPCCNPAHLYDGSNSTNAKDRERRRRGGGRIYRGERHLRSTLTEDQVRKIRGLHRLGFSYREIGLRVPASKRQIASIITYETWTHA